MGADPGALLSKHEWGLAKLLGADGTDMDYYMRKYEIILGRESKNSTADVVIGENMNISRKHATIRYNFTSRCFEIAALGKNGLHVGKDRKHLVPDSPPHALQSGELIRAGESTFHFLLPRPAGELIAAGGAAAWAAKQPPLASISAQPAPTLQPQDAAAQLLAAHAQESAHLGHGLAHAHVSSAVASASQLSGAVRDPATHLSNMPPLGASQHLGAPGDAPDP